MRMKGDTPEDERQVPKKFITPFEKENHLPNMEETTYCMSKLGGGC